MECSMLEFIVSVGFFRVCSPSSGKDELNIAYKVKFGHFTDMKKKKTWTDHPCFFVFFFSIARHSVTENCLVHNRQQKPIFFFFMYVIWTELLVLLITVRISNAVLLMNHYCWILKKIFLLVAYSFANKLYFFKMCFYNLKSQMEKLH